MSQFRQFPPNANLRQLRIQAKDLLRACQQGDPEALDRLGKTHPRFSRLAHHEISAAGVSLTDAQLVIARELGFESWPRLKEHLDSLSRSSTDMHELVANGDIKAIQNELDRDPELVRQLNKAGHPLLYTATLYRHSQAIHVVLEHGAELDIFACAYLGKTTDADLQLKHNPNLAQATAQNGMTALHYAAQTGHLDVVRVLLRHHADVNARDSRGRTALMEACHAGPWKSEPAEEIIQLLLDHGAQIDLLHAAAMGRTDLIEAILNRDGTLIDRPDDQGKTALFHAARNNRIAAVKLLAERGADVNRSDAVGIAALHRTSQQCSDELILFLIAHGANAHLCCYVACGDEVGTRRSLASNPDSIKDIVYDLSVVGYAIHSWQLGTLRILLQHGSKLSKEDQQHILRISNNDQELFDELMAIQNE